MSKKVNVMLVDPIKGLFEAEFADQGDGIYAREYTSGGLLLSDEHGTILAEFKAIEWVAYSVQKAEEDGDESNGD